MAAFCTCKSDLHTYISCKISVTMSLHRLIGSSVHTFPITRAMPVTVVKMNTETSSSYAPLFHSVSLNLSIESSFPAALTYQIYFQSFELSLEFQPFSFITYMLKHRVGICKFLAVHIHEVHPL